MAPSSLIPGVYDDASCQHTICRLLSHPPPPLHPDTDRTTLPPSTTSQDVAQLLLAYFRCLPEPLLTYALHEAVVEAGGDPVRLQALVQSLPLVNRATLDCLMQMLATVAEAKEATKVGRRG